MDCLLAEELIGALGRRLSSVREGDASALFHELAAAEADQLAALADGGVPAALATAEFRWQRSVAAGQGECLNEIRIALRLAAVVPEAMRRDLPPGLRRLAALDPNASDTPEDWLERLSPLPSENASSEELDEVIGALEAIHRVVDSGRRPEILAILFYVAFQRLGDSDDSLRTEKVLALGEQAANSLPPGHRLRWPLLFNHASILRRRSRMTNDPLHIDAAVAAGRALCQERPEEALALSGLATALSLRHGLSAHASDLMEGIACGRTAVNLMASDNPERGVTLTYLASMLITRSRRTGSAADLDESLDRARAAERLGGAHYAEHTRQVLMEVLTERFIRSRKPAHLLELEQWLHRQLATGDHESLRDRLATALAEQFGVTGDIGFLNKAVKIRRELADNGSCPANRHRHLIMAGLTLRARADVTNSVTDLVNGVLYSVRSVAMSPDDERPDLDGLRHRLRALGTTGDAKHILHPAVADEALAVVGDDESCPDLEARALAGWMLWLRVAYSGEQGREETQRAAVMLRPVHLVAPGVVPDEYATFMTEHMAEVTGSEDTHEGAPSLMERRRTDLIGRLLLHRFMRTGEAGVLAEAIRAFRHAIEIAAEEEEKAISWNNLALALGWSGISGRHHSVLAETVNAARQAVELGSVDTPFLPGRLSLLCHALDRLARHDDDQTLAAEALRTGERAVELTPDDHPSRGVHLANLYTAQATERRYSRDISGMREAVERFPQALTLLPAGHRHRTAAQHSYALALQRLAAAANDIEPLRRSEQLLRGTLEEARGPVRYLILTSLIEVLDLLSDRTDDQDALTSAVEFGRLLLADPLSPATPQLQTAHARRCSVLHAHTKDRALVDEGIAALRNVRTAATPGDPDPYALQTLSMLLRWKATDTDDAAFIEEAAQVSRQAVAHAPQELEPLAEHAYVLLLVHRMTGNLPVLRSGVALCIEVLDRTGPDDPAHERRAKNVIDGLQSLYEDTGEPWALEKGMTLARSLMRENPEPGSPWCLGLASLLAHRSDGLQEAAELLNGYLRATPADGPDRLNATDGLRTVLMLQFQQTGAVDFLREAISLLGTGGYEGSRAGRNSLAVSLRALYRRTGDPAVLTAALDHCRDLVTTTPPGTAYRGIYIGNLADCLMDQWELTGEAALLCRSVELSRASVVSSGSAWAYRADNLARLANALVTLTNQDTAQDHGTEAILVAREAVRLSDDMHQNRLTHLLVLGRALRSQGIRQKDRQALAEAQDIDTRAAATSGGLPDQRLHASQAWAACAMHLGDFDEAERAYRYAIGILTDYLGPSLAWGDREYGIDKTGELPGNAAAAAVAAGHPEEAVALLEQSRGLLLAEALHDEIDIEALARHSPGLAEDFHRVRTALRDLELATPNLTGDKPVPAWAARQRLDLGAEWRLIRDRVRKVPGFADFLKPPPLSAVREATVGGTVVIVNISVWRCDALLVTASSTETVPLPDLSARLCVEWANRILAVLEKHEIAMHEVVAARTAAAQASDAAPLHRYHAAKLALVAARTSAETTLSKCLAWLWDTVAEPVVTHLGLEPGGGRRLWWCPTGPLALLPVHAAGHVGDPGRDLLDRAVSSYTPTLRALVSASQSLVRDPEPRMLTVALGHTPGQTPLPNVSRECDHLRALFPPPGNTVLENVAATRDNVLAALASHRWVHFSCHGEQNMMAPAESRLLLADGGLTVADLVAERPSGDFAFLSACRTAATGVTAPNESITLASALCYAGYRHVIATLWSVYDGATADLATTTYDELMSTGRFRPAGSARALHAAVRALRLRYPEQPSVWAPFVHIGI
ncbi:CHAT domain-containing protein [Streptomyces murinus]|uniref:CHAT domain-containing protein n=1 Tax=Streptomyces murinus TaxID=33900 RepID=UPI00380049B1